MNGFALAAGPAVGIIILTLYWARMTASAVLIGHFVGACLAIGTWVALTFLRDDIFTEGAGKTMAIVCF